MQSELNGIPVGTVSRLNRLDLSGTICELAWTIVTQQRQQVAASGETG